MLVCHCAAVNDAGVRAAIASGATTINEVSDACGAGGGCGGCRPMICRLLGEGHNGGCGAEQCAFRALMSGNESFVSTHA